MLLLSWIYGPADLQNKYNSLLSSLILIPQINMLSVIWCLVMQHHIGLCMVKHPWLRNYMLTVDGCNKVEGGTVYKWMFQHTHGSAKSMQEDHTTGKSMSAGTPVALYSNIHQECSGLASAISTKLLHRFYLEQSMWCYFLTYIFLLYMCLSFFLLFLNHSWTWAKQNTGNVTILAANLIGPCLQVFQATGLFWTLNLSTCQE